MQALTGVLPQSSSFDVTLFSWKHEVQQLGVGVPDGTVDEELAGRLLLDDGAWELEYGASEEDEDGA